MTDVTERVVKGVNLLDRERLGWAKDINLTTLDMAHEGKCVLGQLYDDFDTGIGSLGLDDGFGFGFDATNERYAALQSEWEAVIRARQDATGEPTVGGAP